MSSEMRQASQSLYLMNMLTTATATFQFTVSQMYPLGPTGLQLMELTASLASQER